jgi:hypothetical protein
MSDTHVDLNVERKELQRDTPDKVPGGRCRSQQCAVSIFPCRA